MTLAIVLLIVRWFRRMRAQRLLKQMKSDCISGPVYVNLSNQIVELKSSSHAKSIG